MKINSKIVEAILKESIYYFDKGRIYRPTSEELSEKVYYCPRCRKQLTKRRFKTLPIFLCGKCGFMIERENILDSTERIKQHLEERNKIKIEDSNVVIVQNSEETHG
jgi:ribosomal protein L37AE/L43A